MRAPLQEVTGSPRVGEGSCPWNTYFGAGVGATGAAGALLAVKSGMEFLMLRYRPQLKGSATTRNARKTVRGEDFFMVLCLLSAFGHVMPGVDGLDE
jgi:hypothetical protein